MKQTRVDLTLQDDHEQTQLIWVSETVGAAMGRVCRLQSGKAESRRHHSLSVGKSGLYRRRMLNPPH